MTPTVTPQHGTVRRYRQLARSIAGGGLARELLLDGVHLLSEALASGLRIETAAFEYSVLEDPVTRTLAEKLSRSGTEVLIVSRKVLEAMSPVRTPSGAVGIAHRSLSPLSTAVNPASSSLALIAHDVQDPGNVGALLRSAEAAGATAFVACGQTADPFGWKALRGSMGSAFRLMVARAAIDDTLQAFRQAGIQTAALVLHGGQPFFALDWRSPTALLLGNEGAGLPPDIAQQADRQVSIPMQGQVESLNVAVAAALVLYEAFRQRIRKY